MPEVLNYGTSDASAPPRGAVRELLALALPTVAQMASYTVMQFIDTWMLAHSADRVIAPTAAANSGILAFSVISLGMGCLWVVNTLVSQAYGRKDYAACGRYLWQGVWFALVFARVRAAGAAGHRSRLLRRRARAAPGRAGDALHPDRAGRDRRQAGRRPPSGSSCWRSTGRGR